MAACLIVSIQYGVWALQLLALFRTVIKFSIKTPEECFNFRKRRGSASCRQELAIRVPLLWRAWKKDGKTWNELCLPWLAETKWMVSSRICHLEKVLLGRSLAREARILPQINLILNTHQRNPASIFMQTVGYQVRGFAMSSRSHQKTENFLASGTSAASQLEDSFFSSSSNCQLMLFLSHL